jgi:type I restriction enzyme S subunit
MRWPVTKLSSALASAEVFVDGDWIESKDQDPDGNVRLIQLADIGDGVYIDKSNRFLTSAKALELRCTFLTPGDVLVARMPAPLGRACIFPGDTKPSVTAVDICIIRPNQGELDARWLMHCLNAPISRNQIERFATGTTRSRISRSNLGKIKVQLPPLPEQRRIVEVLDRADALRTQRRAALAQLDTINQAIFLDMFGDPRKKGSTGRTPASPRSLGELTRIRTGKLDANAADEEGVYPFFTCAVEPLRINTPAFDCKAVLVAGNGDLNVKYYEGKFNAYQRTYVIESLSDSVLSPRFLYAFLDLYVSELRKQAIGGVIKYIKLPYLTEAQVQLPPLASQQEFARRVAAVETVKTAQSASQSELDALFSSLQHRAFRGEL